MRNIPHNTNELLKSCSYDIIAQILSFCDILDIYNLLSAGKDFEQSIIGFLAAQESISFSCLLRGFKNRVGNDEAQQKAVIRLISLLKVKNLLKHVEFSGLGNLTGATWLSQLKNGCCHLQTLDLSGCHSLDPGPLVEFLTSGGPSLRRIRLTGCIRVGVDAVNAIGEHHLELESISLGGCSQLITSKEINWLVGRLPKLKDLDLQQLTHVKDPLLLPELLQSINLTGCRELRLTGIEQHTSVQMAGVHREAGGAWKDFQSSAAIKLKHLVLDNIGVPRNGLVPGALMCFALGRQLCEVHLSGCEQVDDWEVIALAQLCGHTLTVFQMRACRIGNSALVALGTHCTRLAECDVSACFLISDEGVSALCSGNRMLVHDRSNPKRQRQRSTLKSLKIASLPLLTDAALDSIAQLDSLVVLDIHDCRQIRVSTLVNIMGNLRLLIDLDCRGIQSDPLPFGRRIRQQRENIPPGLRYVDSRPFETDSQEQRHCYSASCCTFQKYSQRLGPTVPMQYMYHCIDCGLIQQVNRGICSSCVSKCHKDHRIYLGSWTRFYCDCSFSSDGGGFWPSCQALFVPPQKTLS